MGEVAERIRAKLTQAFQPERLDIQDDSAKHAGHAGARPAGETHFTVRLESAAFAGLSRVDSHRRVYDALREEMAPDGVHALALSVHAPGERDSGGSLDPA